MGSVIIPNLATHRTLRPPKTAFSMVVRLRMRLWIRRIIALGFKTGLVKGLLVSLEFRIQVHHFMIK